MAVAYVGKYSSSGLSTGSSITLTGVTALPGETLVLVLDGYGTLTGTASDSVGNTWTTRVTSATNLFNTIFHCQVKTALSSGTVTIALTGDNYYNATLSRWTGVGDYLTSNSSYLSGGSASTSVSVDMGNGKMGLMVAGTSSDAAFVNQTGATLNASSISAGWIALDDNVNLKPPTYNFASAGTTYLINTNPLAGSTGPGWVGPNGNSRWGAAIASFVMGSFNLLVDGSFETDGNVDGVADNWTETHTTTLLPTYSLSGSSPQVGSFSQRIQYTGQLLDGTPNKEIRLDQNTNIGSMVAGHKYMFNVWIKGSTANCFVTLGLNAHDSSNNFLSGATVANINPVAGWNKYTVTYVAPVSSSYAKVYVKVDNINVLSTVDVYFDGAEFMIDDFYPIDTDPTYVTGRTLPAPEPLYVQSRTATGMVTKFDNARTYVPWESTKLNTRSWGIGNTEVAFTTRTDPAYDSATTFTRAFTAYDQLAGVTRTVETQPNTLTMDTFSVQTIPNVTGAATNVTTGTTTGVYVTLDYNWNVVGTVVQPITHQWNVIAQVSKSTDYNWNDAGLVSKSTDYNWNTVLSLGALSTTYNWNTLGPVTKSTDYNWNDLLSLGALSADYNWNTLGPVSKSTDYLWNVRSTQPVDADPLGIGWNTYSAIGPNATDLNWNVIKIVDKTADYNWNNYQIVTASDLQTEWNTYGSADSSLAHRWNTYSPVDSSLAHGWYTLSDAADVGLAYQWNVLGAVTGSQTHSWHTLSVSERELSLLWHVLGLIDDTVTDLNWNVLQSIDVSALYRWNYYDVINLSAGYGWNTYGTLDRLRNYNWQTLEILDVTQDLAWHVLEILDLTADVNWNVLEVVSKSLSAQWNVFLIHPAHINPGEIDILNSEGYVLILSKEGAMEILTPAAAMDLLHGEGSMDILDPGAALDII